MKKFLMFALMCVLTIGFVTGCGNNDEEVDKKDDAETQSEYTKHSSNGFSFSYLKSWGETENISTDNNIGFSLILPDRESVLRVNRESLDSNLNLSDYYNTFIDALLNGIGVDPDDITTLDKNYNGMDVRLIRYNYEGNVIERIVYPPKSMYGYSIQYTARGEIFNNAYSEVEKVYNSLEF